jgi:hypothetical protein
LAIYAPFQMATPHRSLLRALRLNLIPSAEACGTPNCDGTEAKPTCGDPNNPCPQEYCYCPDCQARGCTPYWCVYTGGLKKFCQASQNLKVGDQCFSCETDYNVSCTPQGQ